MGNKRWRYRCTKSNFDPCEFTPDPTIRDLTGSQPLNKTVQSGTGGSKAYIPEDLPLTSRELLHHPSEIIAVHDRIGQTPALCAARTGNVQCLELLHYLDACDMLKSEIIERIKVKIK